ncbi:MAG: gamma-glutamylcyclotransferase [Myxococcota bacterium]|nr:gamma-glutamylcyclotransferase [Myxococcota bacterium]MDW8361833.1 gamma-glutamylcyclotransferase family protein [Myxococcales bacterium]
MNGLRRSETVREARMRFVPLVALVDETCGVPDSRHPGETRHWLADTRLDPAGSSLGALERAIGWAVPGRLVEALPHSEAGEGCSLVVLDEQAGAHAALWSEPRVPTPRPGSDDPGWGMPIDAFFVYGTLMRGECREHVLRAHDPVRWTPAVLEGGRLRDCGSYPGLEPTRRMADRVHGELVAFEVGCDAAATVDPGTGPAARFAALVERLDDIEGFLGFGVAGSLYERRLVRVHAGDVERLAWAYVLARPEDYPLLGTGDWRLRERARGRSR